MLTCTVRRYEVSSKGSAEMIDLRLAPCAFSLAPSACLPLPSPACCLPAQSGLCTSVDASPYLVYFYIYTSDKLRYGQVPSDQAAFRVGSLLDILPIVCSVSSEQDQERRSCRQEYQFLALFCYWRQPRPGSLRKDP